MGLKGFEEALGLGMVTCDRPLRCKAINQPLQAILRDPDVAAKLESLGALPRPSSPEAFAELLKREYTTWGEIVKQSGAKVD